MSDPLLKSTNPVASSTMGEPPPAPPAKGAVKLGVIWIAAGFGAMQIARFGSNVVLARLLFPEAFGLFALTYVFITGLHLFSDLGIRVSIIQNPRGDERDFLNTAWTVQVVRGFLIWMAALALSWPAAFWRPNPEPNLLWLLPIVSFTAVIEGFISTNIHGLYRHLQQRRAVIIEMLSTSGGIVAMVTWAYFDPGLRALAAGPVTNSSLQLILSHLLPGPRNRFCWDRSAARELIHFGRWIFLSTLLAFLADQSDRLVVSFLSMELLGIYHLANQLASVPSTVMGTLARQVVLPLYSRMLDAGKDLKDVQRIVQVRTGAAMALLIGGLIAVGPTLISCLYDDRFAPATWIVQMLAMVVMVNILDSAASSLLIARGNPRIYALSNAVKVTCLAIFMPLSIWLDGPRWIPGNTPEIRIMRSLIFSMILGETGRYICTGLSLRRAGLPIFGRDLCWATFALALGWGARILTENVGPALPKIGRRWPTLLAQMGLEAVTVVACWSVVVVLGWKAGWFHERQKHVKPGLDPQS